MNTPASRAAGPRGKAAEAAPYFLMSAALWFVVDFGTAGGFRPGYLAAHGAALLAFYLGFPALFAVLACVLRLGELTLLSATAAEMLFVEAVCVGNPLIIGFPACLAAIPLAMLVYAPLTFYPLWILRGTMRKRRGWAIAAAVAVAGVSALTTLRS